MSRPLLPRPAGEPYRTQPPNQLAPAGKAVSVACERCRKTKQRVSTAAIHKGYYETFMLTSASVAVVGQDVLHVLKEEAIAFIACPSQKLEFRP